MGGPEQDKTAGGIVEVGGYRFRSPIVWPSVSAFGGLFPVPVAAVRRLLPSPRLHPVTIPGGRGLLWVVAARQPLFPVRHEDGTLILGAPVADCLVAAVVTEGRRPHPWTPLQIGRPGSPVGLFEMYLPITSVPGRDAGRVHWGEPKFLADLDFREDDTVMSVTVSESGSEILTLSVRKRGRLRAYRTQATFFSCTAERLYRFRMSTRGGCMERSTRRGAATLRLGSHTVARRLSGLSVSSRSAVSFRIVDDYQVQYAAVDAGSARRVLEPYLGQDATHGRLTVEYPDTGPIDLYAGVSAAQLALGVPADPGGGTLPE